MQAPQVQVVGFECGAHRPGGIPVGQGKTELGIGLAGPDVFMTVGFDPRGDTQQDGSTAPALVGARQPVQGLQLEVVVEHHPAHTAVQGIFQFFRRFVVAVEIDPAGGKPGLQGDKEFAAGHHVQPQPLFHG